MSTQMYRCYSRTKSSSGFTLIELLITIAIVAILAGIALPSYKNYVDKSKIRTAQADLVALSLNLENHYQRSLKYKTFVMADDPATTAGLKVIFKGWSPASNDFNFKVNVGAPAPFTGASGYQLEASFSFPGFTACKLILKSDNNRSAPGCPFGAVWL